MARNMIDPMELVVLSPYVAATTCGVLLSMKIIRYIGGLGMREKGRKTVRVDHKDHNCIPSISCEYRIPNRCRLLCNDKHKCKSMSLIIYGCMAGIFYHTGR